MCLTTTNYYHLHAPPMIPEPSHYCGSSRQASHLDLLLDNCDVSSPASISLLSNKKGDDMEDLDLNDVLMSSISLDESASLLDLDEEEPEAAPYTTLFNSKKGEFEWNDEFSMLLKLKTTRLLTIYEGDEES